MFVLICTVVVFYCFVMCVYNMINIAIQYDQYIIIAINPGFVACYDGFQEVLINADTVKQFLTDVNTVCFLVLGQHT